jgi:hypothetical protein
MRDASPGPMLSTNAVRASMASMSRKSSCPESGIVRRCHVAPPSSVRSTVPFAPLAHATRSLTALIPRSRSVTPLTCGTHLGSDLDFRVGA